MAGTALILFRWVLFAAGLIIYFKTSKYRKFRTVRFMLLSALVLLVIEYGWNKIHQQRLKSEVVTTAVSVMTYNLYFKNTVPGSLVNIIKKNNPDILAVQELTPAWNTQLNKSIGSKYPYKKLLALKGTHGIGLYSKFPVSGYQVLSNHRSAPIAQTAEILINGKKIQVINVHLASPAIAVENPNRFISLYKANYELRKQQFNKINNMAQRGQSKYKAQIFIGDLNTTPYEPLFRDIKETWVNLFALAGKGFGFNFPNSAKIPPLLSLDYIFIRGDIKGADIKVIPGGSSDHLAVVGQIEL